MCKKSSWILLCILSEITWKWKCPFCAPFFFSPPLQKWFFQLLDVHTNKPQQIHAWNFVCEFFNSIFFRWKNKPFCPFTLILSVQTQSVCGVGKCHLLRVGHVWNEKMCLLQQGFGTTKQWIILNDMDKLWSKVVFKFNQEIGLSECFWRMLLDSFARWCLKWHVRSSWFSFKLYSREQSMHPCRQISLHTQW